MKACKRINKFCKKSIQNLFLFTLIPVLLLNCDDGPSEFVPGDASMDDEVELAVIELNLRIHIMKDITMLHPTGTVMESWVSPTDVTEKIIPELNAIWDQAKIKWRIESIMEEAVVKDNTYEASINYIVNCKRNAEGESDPARLPLLYHLMQPENRSKTEELGKNLFHIYLFPFIGNTSQGNAMSNFDYHCVVGTWSNKHNGGGVPEKTLLTEYHDQLIRGSLSRTAAHELGHVLHLKHNECSANCLMSGGSDGYLLAKAQIETARFAAIERLQ